MDISTLFGLVCVITLLIAWASPSQVCQKLGLVLLAAWASSNVAVEVLGFLKAPVIIPSLDAAFAVVIATIGYLNRSRIALVVLLIYLLVGAVHVMAFILRTQSTYSYYATLNILFLAQLLTVGIAGARMAVSHRSDWRGQRLRHHPARG